MKILVARLNHETNTFSPIATPLKSFGDDGPLYGMEAYKASKNTRTGIAAYIDVLEKAGHEVVVACSATANPSGTVCAQAYTHLCDTIVSAAKGCDAVALDLHGKMTDKIINNSDIVISFKTYPHIDMYETGAHAGRLLVDMINQRIQPKLAWRRLPLTLNTLCSRTDIGPMHEAVELARAAEAQGMLGVSVLAGFPLADIAAPCISVVVVSDKDTQAAEDVAQRIAEFIWSRRSDFIYKNETLESSIARAKTIANEPGSGPVLLLDHGDNCMSGGTCDDMNVLHEALKQGLEDIVVGPICDPEAVDQLIKAGLHATVTLQVGDKVPLTQLGITHPLRPLTGVVSAISDGQYVVSGPTYTGQRIHMGRTVCLNLPQAKVMITETPQEHWDLGIFSHIGINAPSHRFILLKSRMYCRPVFAPLAKALIECDGGGVTGADHNRFPYTKLQRPVYPFDINTEWS
jgi:microcystin degradation protein MlrC